MYFINENGNSIHRDDILAGIHASGVVNGPNIACQVVRTIHHGYMFELKGESYRKKTAKAVTSAA